MQQGAAWLGDYIRQNRVNVNAVKIGRYGGVKIMRKETHSQMCTYKPPTKTSLFASNTHTFSACPQETPSRHDSTNISEEKPIWQHLYTPQGQAQRTRSKIRGHDVKMFSRTHPPTHRELYSSFKNIFISLF